MAVLTDEAIVLGARPYSNTSLIVTFLTKEQGKVRLVARGVRSAKSRVGVALEPASESSSRMEPARRLGFGHDAKMRDDPGLPKALEGL